MSSFIKAVCIASLTGEFINSGLPKTNWMIVSSVTTPTSLPSSITGSCEKPALRRRLCAVVRTSVGPTVMVARSSCGLPIRSLRSWYCSRRIKPWSSSQKSLNNLDRYLLPVSQANVTTRLGSVCSRQYRNAAASNVPVEDPARMPSSLSSLLAVANDSKSRIG